MGRTGSSADGSGGPASVCRTGTAPRPYSGAVTRVRALLAAGALVRRGRLQQRPRGRRPGARDPRRRGAAPGTPAPCAPPPDEPLPLARGGARRPAAAARRRAHVDVAGRRRADGRALHHRSRACATACCTSSESPGPGRLHARARRRRGGRGRRAVHQGARCAASTGWSPASRAPRTGCSPSRPRTPGAAAAAAAVVGLRAALAAPVRLTAAVPSGGVLLQALLSRPVGRRGPRPGGPRLHAGRRDGPGPAPGARRPRRGRGAHRRARRARAHAGRRRARPRAQRRLRPASRWPPARCCRSAVALLAVRPALADPATRPARPTRSASWPAGVAAGLLLRELLGLLLPAQASAVPDPLRLQSLVGPLALPGGQQLPAEVLPVLALGLAAGLLAERLLVRSRTGRALRAVADDPDAAALCGISARARRAAGLRRGRAARRPRRACSTPPGARSRSTTASCSAWPALPPRCSAGSARCAARCSAGSRSASLQSLVVVVLGGQWSDLVPLAVLVVLLAARPAGGRPGGRVSAVDLAAALYLLLAALGLALSVSYAGLPVLSAGAFVAVGGFGTVLLGPGGAGLPLGLAVLLAVSAAAAVRGGWSRSPAPGCPARRSRSRPGRWPGWSTRRCRPSRTSSAASRGSSGARPAVLVSPTLGLEVALTPAVHVGLALGCAPPPLAALVRVQRGPGGLDLAALREGPELAASLGVPVAARRRAVLTVTAALCGVAGAGTAVLIGLVARQDVGPLLSPAAVRRGARRRRGALVGAGARRRAARPPCPRSPTRSPAPAASTRPAPAACSPPPCSSPSSPRAAALRRRVPVPAGTPQRSCPLSRRPRPPRAWRPVLLRARGVTGRVRRRCAPSTASTWSCAPARCTRSSGRTARASRPCCRCSPATCRRATARSRWPAGPRGPRPGRPRPARAWPVRPSAPCCPSGCRRPSRWPSARGAAPGRAAGRAAPPARDAVVGAASSACAPGSARRRCATPASPQAGAGPGPAAGGGAAAAAGRARGGHGRAGAAARRAGGRHVRRRAAPARRACCAALAGNGAAVLLVEHDMRLVGAVADRVTVLDRGRVLAAGRPDDVRDDPAVRRAYLGGPA